MSIILSHARLGAFTISLLMATNVLASPSEVEFRDPLNIAASEQINPLDKPLIGSSQYENTVVMVGPTGLILASADAGATWKQADVPVQSDLVAVDMVSVTKGWAVGHDSVILVTIDGGMTWTKQFDGLLAAEQFKNYYENLIDNGDVQAVSALELIELNYRDGPGLPYLDVWFENEAVGVVVGAFGNIAHTDDGGSTWLPLTHRIDNEAGLHLNSVAGVGDNVFIASERGTVFKLDRETDTFDIIETGYPGSFTGITGDENQIIAYGLRGTAYRSTDDGTSWQELTGFPHSTINDAVRRLNRGFVFSNQAGDLVFTDRDIKKFEVVGPEEATGLTSVVEIDNNDFLVTTLDGVRRVSAPDKKIIQPKVQE